MKKHVNIPIFIPHLGCPNMCVFCNQRTISGVSNFDINTVRETIESALSTIDESQESEIAFFGGSFTGIDRNLMISLLKIAHEYVLSGRVKSIRCSTRPDYISREILELLKDYGVSCIELGLQSTSDNVLSLSKRGHGRNDEDNACKLIKQYGFSLVGQMMIGLPGSTLQDELETADFIVKSGAEGARIYPTVVFRDTELYSMSKSGEYAPLSLDEAVKRSAAVASVFIDAGVEIIRTGLCASDNLVSDDTYYAGPNHPALGELVASEIFYNKIEKMIDRESFSSSDHINIFVFTNSLSKAIGQKRINLRKLKERYKGVSFSFIPSNRLSEYEILIERKREEIKCT